MTREAGKTRDTGAPSGAPNPATGSRAAIVNATITLRCDHCGWEKTVQRRQWGDSVRVSELHFCEKKAS